MFKLKINATSEKCTVESNQLNHVYFLLNYSFCLLLEPLPFYEKIAIGAVSGEYSQ